jgi:5-methylcytosine-specific restriction endonuclease McrA
VSRAKNGPMLRRLVLRDGLVCHYCKSRTIFWDAIATDPEWKRGRVATVDHRTPQARGGPHRLWNCVLACHTCNARKHLRPYLDFMFEMWAREAA